MSRVHQTGLGNNSWNIPVQRQSLSKQVLATAANPDLFTPPVNI